MQPTTSATTSELPAPSLSPDPVPTLTVSVNGSAYRCVDLPALGGERFAALPLVLRLLLENVARHLQGEERAHAVAALRDWTAHGTSTEEIAFLPGRVLMHDTTCTPALVDIAAMRDAVAEAGGDPACLRPSLPVDVSVDHSLAVDVWGQPDAAQHNLAQEYRRHRERYQFLRWAAGALPGVRIHPPGTGIMHTINLEQLASVVIVQTRPDGDWLVPDTLIGTDSHTPMINGIGVLGWGVGGLEAQTVMFGMPTMLRIPEVIGVRLTGQLGPGVQATDLALTVTQRLRAINVSGEFVEFFGPGVATLSAGERCVVANMAPEYGATTGYFPVDARTLDSLQATGRSLAQRAQIEAYCRAVGLWFDPHAHPRYTRTVEIDLGTIDLHVAGPRRPQDLRALKDVPAVLQAEKARFVPTAQWLGSLPRFPVAIAAITSCTNTSDPALLIAAGLVARKARAHGLKVPAYVKTSLAPGSPAARTYLARSGLLADLQALGFDIVGHGCTTCIGNSGPLTAPIQAALENGSAQPVAVLSGNRNFPGRVHPALELGLIMSPALVVAFALAGRADVDIRNHDFGHDVRLADLWPTHEEIAAQVRAAVAATDFSRAFALAQADPRWEALSVPSGPRFPWSANSTILRPPPFAGADIGPVLGPCLAYPLLILGDDVTTDHISPASAIPPDSPVADYLVERGEARADLNVFASRRGNWEVMVRAAFYNQSLRNLLQPDAPTGHTLHIPSNTVMPLFEAAQRYREAGHAVVIVAGARYGTGSSRDWAAKGPRLLGVRAVLATSFERIHRSNLIGMGIVPIRLHTPLHETLMPTDRIELDISADVLAVRGTVPVRVVRADGSRWEVAATAAIETQLELALLRAGGVIPTILNRVLRKTPSAEGKR